MKLSLHKVIRDHHAQSAIFLLISLLFSLALRAQSGDGNAGINQANTMIRSYFDTGTQLLLAIGALLALIGAVRVFHVMQSKDGHAGREIAIWFGSCIFLVVVATVIKSFFGL